MAGSFIIVNKYINIRFTKDKFMQDLGVAVILGLVEGITEYLPVSSTGHLIVAGNLLNFSGEKASCFEVFIQLGAILAVLVLYWRRFLGLIPAQGIRWRQEAGFSGIRGLTILALTTLPALIAGALAHRLIKQHLFNPVTVALALAVGGIGILLAERYRPNAENHGIGPVEFQAGFYGWMFPMFGALARHVALGVHNNWRPIFGPG